MADRLFFGSFKFPIFLHLLFLNSAMIETFALPLYPPIVYAAESVDAVA